MRCTRRTRAVLSALCCAAVAPLPAAEVWQTTDDIIQAAEQRVLADRGAGKAGLSVNADPLDPYLRVRACPAPLHTDYAGAPDGPRIAVQVACPVAPRWKVYVAVRVQAVREVVVLARSLPRDHLLQPGDLVVRPHDVSGLTLGFMTRSNQAVGRRLRRSLTAGSVLTPQHLATRVDVARGQEVTLVARVGTSEIRMAGEAEASGAIGQRIRVRNRSSGRVVEGVILEDGSIRVTP